MKVLVTGANGFIGKNLVVRLRELGSIFVLSFDRGDSIAQLRDSLYEADFVIHLAGENRPKNIVDYDKVNVGTTNQICNILKDLRKSVPLLFTSSTQVDLDNPYGRSKLSAEQLVLNLSKENGNPVSIYRLSGVFGKWCKPNYNSVVATFCYNKANDLPVNINDENTRVNLIYVDDVVNAFIALLNSSWSGILYSKILPEYNITLGDLSAQIDRFRNSRSTLLIDRVGIGLSRALYSTYVSYLPKEKFSYVIPKYGDARGLFVEIIKTSDSGQFSYFTAGSGITRGGHYHHTKSEKFLVVKGKARFAFRHILTNEIFYLETDGDNPQVVETVPGWAHDVTNIGNEEMMVMLWANEIFDRNKPDTISSKV